MLFYKVLTLFWGVLEHALMLGGSKIALFFTLFTLLQYLSPQPDTNGLISSGFDEGTPSKKLNVFRLVSCPSVRVLDSMFLVFPLSILSFLIWLLSCSC